MNNNIQLRLVGITYNQIESGVYALILEDIYEGKRLAIVIGYPEAQSIECKLQNVRTPRPLTHDLMASLLKTLGARLLRVDIHKLSSGPYAGRMTVENIMGERFEIDARSSDAIALAIRVKAPIYTNRELLEKEGYIPKSNEKKNLKKGEKKESQPSNKYSKYNIIQLNELLQKFVEDENYEEAALIKSEIDRREMPENTQ